MNSPAKKHVKVDIAREYVSTAARVHVRWNVRVPARRYVKQAVRGHVR